MARLKQKQGDEQVKTDQMNQKAFHDREAGQRDLMKKDADIAATNAKAAAAERLAQQRANDQAARSADQRALTQIKMMQPRNDGGGSFLP